MSDEEVREARRQKLLREAAEKAAAKAKEPHRPRLEPNKRVSDHKLLKDYIAGRISDSDGE